MRFGHRNLMVNPSVDTVGNAPRSFQLVLRDLLRLESMMPTQPHIVDLLHRSRVALRHPGSWVDVPQLLAEIDVAIPETYARLVKRRETCWCGEIATDGRHCNQHTENEVGDG